MFFVKENGTIVVFDKNKIKKAIVAAMRDGGIYLPDIARLVSIDTEKYFLKEGGEQNVVTREQVDKYIFDRLIHYGQNLTAKSYEDFKILRKYQKQTMDSDDSIISLIGGENEELRMENSNKAPSLAPTQRDLIAGEISKSIARRKMIPAHLIHAHDEGIIHIHDLDYYIQPIHNCDLINLKDMLDNGTVINGTLIEPPHTFKTAATVSTQIVAQVSSCQYGGQTFTTAHLAPYVRKSYNKYLKEVSEELKNIQSDNLEKIIEDIARKRTLQEVADGVQTIQYQLNTLMTTNGQSPFLSIALWIEEDKEYEKENAMIIEEILKQRYLGVKDEEGHYISPAFPKLLYFLDDNNVYPDSKYYYLTELAAKCSAKRLVPDYISTKVMKENIGEVFPCMGRRKL